MDICPHLRNPCTNFKYLSISRIINMLSIIVEYYYCVRSVNEPVITRSFWAAPVHKRKKNSHSTLSKEQKIHVWSENTAQVL